ncbi:alpha/beta hydrolase [Streptomyces himalayensis]|uniref:Alpha/beta fold hydrolase n=1 Tax=Streptomyces himalayensis subsp. himalayensis TaxID=2756131 RepID=A0A7W0DMA4_9ACTN|nr:alpha/beta hydrolase [Streptomyces himalayensis]MBA2947686.1 alpha/beta fold hydrolase [Streptomyces himalayensis subsp. himalayensis]
MRAAVISGAAGSMVLTALVAAPAGSNTPTGNTSAASTSARSTSADSAAAEMRGTAVAAARAAAAGIRFGACPEAENLPDHIRCGTVTVPLDYADPDGRQIKLTVSRVEATGRVEAAGDAPVTGGDGRNGRGGGKSAPVARQGALVFNPGGPGASGMYFPMAGGMPEWQRIAAAYDLVGYAPRGVGRSAPLSCQDPEQFVQAPTQAPTRPSESYKKQRIAEAKAYAQGCARRAGTALRHYTTLNNARDLDVLRAALGERKLTFVGASYGTYIGAVHTTLFPSHVRRMVFDSAVDPDPRQIWYRNNLDQSFAFEQRWEDFRTWVARHDSTYHLGATPEAVQLSYEKVRAELARRPAGGTVGPGQLQAAYLKAGYYDDYWPMRAAALTEYLKGNPQPLISQAAPHPQVAGEEENSAAVYTAVQCNDAPWPTDWATWDRDNTRLARVAPFTTWDNAWMNLPCAFWPAPRQQPVDVGTAEGALPPTLILAAERDAATPYQGAQELQLRLPGSVLVTERGAGTHGIGGGANQCVNGYLDAYLLAGRLPTLRAGCAPHAEPKPLSLRSGSTGAGPT